MRRNFLLNGPTTNQEYIRMEIHEAPSAWALIFNPDEVWSWFTKSLDWMKLCETATSLTPLWCTWVLSGRSYFTFTPVLMAELDFQIYCPVHALLFLSTAMAGRWFLGSTPLKVLRSAVKTNLLINPIDRFENRGKCDLHTAGMINALTDFFFSPPKSDFLRFWSEGEGGRRDAHRSAAVQTRMQSVLLCTEG